MRKIILIDVIFETNHITKESVASLFCECSECGPICETYQLFKKDSEEALEVIVSIVSNLIEKGYINEVSKAARNKLRGYV